MNAIILCGGAATRYGGNKVLTIFKKKSLLEWNIQFCIDNGIHDIFITTNERFNADIAREIEQIGKTVSPINEKLSITLDMQEDDKYGTAAALIPWKNLIDDDFIVIFGDNYYDGKIDFSLGDKDCIATYKTFTKSKENLRLSYVEDDMTIIEKPHLYDEGLFFVGFMMFKKSMLKHLMKLQPSRRGEYEITEFFNSGTNRGIHPLNMHWFDITSREEIEYV